MTFLLLQGESSSPRGNLILIGLLAKKAFYCLMISLFPIGPKLLLFNRENESYWPLNFYVSERSSNDFVLSPTGRTLFEKSSINSMLILVGFSLSFSVFFSS